MVMFNSYVSLPEGIPLDQSSVDQEGFSVDTSSRIILPAPDQCKQSTGTVESVEFTIKFPPPMNSLFNIYIYIHTYIYTCNYNFKILLEKQMGWMLRENHEKSMQSQDC